MQYSKSKTMNVEFWFSRQNTKTKNTLIIVTGGAAVVADVAVTAFQAFPSTAVCVVFSTAVVAEKDVMAVGAAGAEVTAGTAGPLLVISSSLKATTTLRLLDTIPPLLDVDPGLRRFPLWKIRWKGGRDCEKKNNKIK